ncbi:MAG: hypothetical protein WC795_02555 [Candidatus Paceibacterota bacterium]|jgi:hypothetical protein
MQKDQAKQGIPVIYWETIYPNGKRINPFKAEIISEPKNEGKEINCTIRVGTEEKTVSIKNLDTISPGSIMAAQIEGLDVGANAFNDATKKFFGDRGVNVIIH